MMPAFLAPCHVERCSAVRPVLCGSGSYCRFSSPAASRSAAAAKGRSGRVVGDRQLAGPAAEGRLYPPPRPGTEAPVSVAAIVNRRYTLAAQGGVPVGTHKIEIMAWANKQQPPPALSQPGGDMFSTAAIVLFIPAKYNTKSTLKITVPSGSGRIAKDFDLTD